MPRIQRVNYEEFRYFSRREFNEPDKMSPELLRRLDHARHLAGVPFTVGHVRQFREGDSGDHGSGNGVDIRCHFSGDRFRILCGALGINPTNLPPSTFNRIGIYDRHIHLGHNLSAAQNVVWVGDSR
jgi:hypothetical protein